METSIENIWKKGFTHEPSPIPELKDLDSLKSRYFVDSFKRRYQANIIGLVLTAILILFAFVMGGVPFIGIYLFGLFASLALLGQIEMGKLRQLNKAASNYDYIKAVNEWLQNLLAKFSLIYRIWVPLLFIGFMLALLRTTFFVPFIGETLAERLFNVPDAWAFVGLPVLVVLVLVILAIVVSYLSDVIFKKEMTSIYGDLISQLDALLVELNDLKK